MLTKKPSQLITGTAILFVGAGFLLDAMNVVAFGSFFGTWWPVLLLLAAVVTLISNRDNWLWALLLGVVGVLVLFNNIEVLDVDVWKLFWPVVLIGVGLAVLFGRGGHRVLASKSDRSDLTAVLGATTQKNDSGEFTGSKIISVMGGATLDLRKATIKKEATVEVIAFWGAAEIYVPKNVVVKNEVMAVLGGVENKTDPETDKNAPVLYVIGQAIMAGVEIRN